MIISIFAAYLTEKLNYPIIKSNVEFVNFET